MRLSIICGMALRDYWHERALSLCAVLALATVLAPLLILFGVRNGVISNLQERLLQDPRNLEIVPVGSGKYGKDFFEELRKRPDVGYVVPQTRAIAATIGLLPASEKKGGLPPNPVNVSLIPSGAGDPLTRRFAGNAALKDDEIILTAPAADKLGARAGTILSGRGHAGAGHNAGTGGNAPARQGRTPAVRAPEGGRLCAAVACRGRRNLPRRHGRARTRLGRDGARRRRTALPFVPALCRES